MAVEISRVESGVVVAAATAVGLGASFAVVFGLFFRFGIAVYAILLRMGLNLSGS
ncbi:hypothetical protein ACFQJ6_15515 [Halorussus caseinilyticus]|uniref:Uncharacterized protein n=2 Tax=Halorussus caseinilyticus TaxID=3034025 RepID=A0ABD5WLA9_9EURY